MTAPVGFLDFFVLEASDYIEQLDALLQGSGESQPDADAVQRAARSLRGSATMARLSVFAQMAAGMERVGRALREGALEWSPALRGVLVATVDDCKLLLRNVRAWSASDDARAQARIDELTRHAPLRPATPLASSTTAGHDSYLATEASNIGAGLELLATRPTDRDAAANVLRRVRALRGIASVKDHPALADVLEASEAAAQPLELGESTLSPDRITLLRAAATLMRAISEAVRSGRLVNPAGPEMSSFTTALDAIQSKETGADRVVPIAELFYHDGGPTVVTQAPNPPTSPTERFRLEVVSQGEHLRGLVVTARSANDEPSRDRVRRALRQALRALRQAAESFGERDVAEFVAMHNDAVVRLDARALDSLDQVAALLAQPGGEGASLGDRIRAVRSARGTPVAAPVVQVTPRAVVPGPAAAAPAPAVAPPRPAIPPRATTPPRPATPRPATPPRATTPSGSIALDELLDRGIRTLDTLPKTPLSNPVALPEQPPVPIDVLVYRGRAAVERAREIRDEARRSGAPLTPDRLAELFDLIDLALVE
jgi:HPt (histidine-containing phosphotransfer) domain-containing protein